MKTSNGIKVPSLRIEMAANALAPFLRCDKDCDTCPFYQNNDRNPDIAWNCALLNVAQVNLKTLISKPGRQYDSVLLSRRHGSRRQQQG